MQERPAGIKTLKMKSIITYGCAAIICVLAFIGVGRMNSYPVFYDHNGQLVSSQVKIYCDTITPTTASSFSIPISAAGFSSIKSVHITAGNNTTTIASMPIVIVQSISTSAIVVNILTQNNATTTILGITVLSGSPLQAAASTTGFLLNVYVEGT